MRYAKRLAAALLSLVLCVQAAMPVTAIAQKMEFITAGHSAGPAATGSLEPTVTKALSPRVVLSKTRYVYDGAEKMPSVTVKVGTKTLRATDYEVYFKGGRTSVGTYKVYVTLKGAYSGTISASFVINPRPTSVKSFSRIKGKNAYSIRWAKRERQVDGYQIQYSTDKTFKKNINTVTVKRAGNTSAVIKKGIKKGTYYARVRTYKAGGGYSEWSN